MAKVEFCNASGKVLKTTEVSAGALLFDAATQMGLPVASSCLKEGVCGKCVMRVVSGAENLSPLQPPERRLLKKENRDPETERMSCQATVEGDCKVSTGYW